MTVIGNVHDADRGRQVRALASRRLAGIAGMRGTVTDVESHGANPWTRYGVRFASGASFAGLVYGEDFEFADGRPQRRRGQPANDQRHEFERSQFDPAGQLCAACGNAPGSTVHK